MTLLLLFDRRETCLSCKLRRAMLQSLDRKYKGLRTQRIAADKAAEQYPGKGCALLVDTSDYEPPVEYDFGTRSDAPCMENGATSAEDPKAFIRELLREHRSAPELKVSS